jgi:hypothetical protein
MTVRKQLKHRSVVKNILLYFLNDKKSSQMFYDTLDIIADRVLTNCRLKHVTSSDEYCLSTKSYSSIKIYPNLRPCILQCESDRVPEHYLFYH